MRTPTLAGLTTLLPVVLVWGCGLEDYKVADTAPDGGAVDPADGSETGSAVDTGLPGGPGTGGTGTGGEDPRDPIELASVTPDYGITAGGDTVTIAGGPFDPSVEVRFAGESAVVTSVTDTAVVVTTPATTQTGPVEVSVETDGGLGSQGDAFRFWEDARGRYGLVGVVELARYTGDSWESESTEDTRTALVYFTEPHLFRWYERYTSTLETCWSETDTRPLDVPIFDPGVEAIALVSDSGSVMNLAYDGLGFTAEPDSITAGGRYDLVSPGGILPVEDVAAVFDVPRDGPSVTNPPISTSRTPFVSQFHTFQWTPTGADWVLLRMTVGDEAADGGVDSVSCAVADDGEFDFDGSHFTVWSGGALAVVSVAAVSDQHDATLPWNQGRSAVAAMVTTVGAAYTY